MTILTPDHPLWPRFITRLIGPEGCNFRIPDGTVKATWKCAHGTDKTHAQKILLDMDDIDVNATLEAFEQQGALCDCQILFKLHGPKTVSLPETVADQAGPADAVDITDGERFRQTRKDLGMSQRQFALSLGLTGKHPEQTVYRFETDRQRIPEKVLQEAERLKNKEAGT